MKGIILDFTIQTNSGIISGDDNNRYRFSGAEWKDLKLPKKGQRVDFGINEGEAIEIYLTSGSQHLQGIVVPKMSLPIILIGGYLLLIILFFTLDIVNLDNYGSFTGGQLTHSIRLELRYESNILLEENINAQAFLGWCFISLIVSSILVYKKSKYLRKVSVVLSIFLLLFLFLLLHMKSDDRISIPSSPATAFWLSCIILIGQIVYGKLTNIIKYIRDLIS